MYEQGRDIADVYGCWTVQIVLYKLHLVRYYNADNTKICVND